MGVWGKSCPDSLPHQLSSQPQTSEGHANLQGIRKHGKNFLDISVIFLMHKNALRAKLGKQGEELLSQFLIQFIVHYTLLRDAQK